MYSVCNKVIYDNENIKYVKCKIVLCFAYVNFRGINFRKITDTIGEILLKLPNISSTASVEISNGK